LQDPFPLHPHLQFDGNQNPKRSDIQEVVDKQDDLGFGPAIVGLQYLVQCSEVGNGKRQADQVDGGPMPNDFHPFNVSASP
jgi:hypothetical protein